MLAYQTGRHALAVEMLRKAITIEPRAEYVVNLSQAYRGLGDLKSCLEACRRAVQFGPGWKFYRTGWAALRHGGPDMNTLVMLGTTAAYAYSVVATFAPGVLPAGAVHVYYEAAATIIALILAGRWLEARAKGRAAGAIRALLDLQPKTATVLRDGREV